MRTLRVYAATAAVAAAASAATAAVALWDHRHPTPEREWVSAWYCAHYGVRCGDTEPWHAAWHRREPYYEYGFGAGLTVTAIFGIAAASRLRDRRLTAARGPADDSGAGRSPSIWPSG